MVVSGPEAQHAGGQALRQRVPYQLAHLALLLLDGERGIVDVEAPFTDHALVLVQEAGLEYAEALLPASAALEIPARLLILARVPAPQTPAQRHVQRHAGM